MFENTIYNFFTKDVYVANSLHILNEDTAYINFLIRKKELSELETNLMCCFFSSIIYDYTKDFSYLKLDSYQIFTHDNGLVYGIFIVNKRIYVVFKGSSTLNDFLQDSNIILSRTKYFPGKVHDGFCNFLTKDKNYKKIFKELETIIHRFKYTDIYITGHSLGGALSSLFYSLCKRYIPFQSVDLNIKNVTFGSPRVGNNDFTKNLVITRVVNKNDIITWFPFPIFYRHIDIKIHLNPKFNFLPSILDHDINNYYNYVENLAKKELFSNINI